MLKQRVNRTYNTVEAIDFVPQFDNEDLGEVAGNNDSSDSSEYEEDTNDNITLIQNIKRPKKKCVLGPVKSLDITMVQNNYDSCNATILKKVLKSKIDKWTYQWTATTNSAGHVNAANVMPQRPGPQTRARNKLTLLDIWRQFFTNEIIADIAVYKQ